LRDTLLASTGALSDARLLQKRRLDDVYKVPETSHIHNLAKSPWLRESRATGVFKSLHFYITSVRNPSEWKMLGICREFAIF
jgi:hypothetical protein